MSTPTKKDNSFISQLYSNHGLSISMVHHKKKKKKKRSSESVRDEEKNAKEKSPSSVNELIEHATKKYEEQMTLMHETTCTSPRYKEAPESKSRRSPPPPVWQARARHSWHNVTSHTG